jgi:phage repressor protein C with HTH and peptisase S24 domain
MNLGGRIKKVREQLKLTQEELARRARLPGKQQTIQALETRDSKRSEYAAALCDALGVNLQWALTGQGPQWRKNGEVEPESGAKAFHPEDPAGDEEIRIAEETVKFSGGRGHLVSYEPATDREPATYRLSWFHKERINPARAKRFRVVGNSMEPLLYSGDSILVNLDETQVREGLVYVFRHGDELKVKKLFPKSDGSLILRSINREEYPDDVVPAEQVAEQVTIIGRVRDKSGRGGL